jgi:transcription elongation factor Elf1
MSITFKPLPCPFCGCAEVTVQQGSTFRWLIAACQGCGAQSGEVRVQTMGAGTPSEWADAGEALTIAEWNKRK